MSRFADFLRETPPVTLAVIAICLSLFLLQNALDMNLSLITMCPSLVIDSHQYYRILTHAIFHSSLMHIGMNMITTYQFSPGVEKRLGTLRLGLSILWSILLSSFLYIGISWLLSQLFGYKHLWYQHAVGFSGVVFHVIVLDAHSSPNQSFTIFWLVTVPGYVYPWALLVLVQLILPNVSFLGHLCGVLTGTFQAYGYLDYLLVSESVLIRIESFDCMQKLVRLPSFVPSFDTTLRLQHHQESTSILRGIRRLVGITVKWGKDILETIRVYIFGRGHRLNSNARFGERRLDDGWGPGRVLSPIDVLEEAEEEEDDDDEKNEEISALV